MNNVSLLGRLTKDVEIMYTQNGVAIGTFTLAVNRKFKNQQGEYDTDFIRCKAFKKTAEIIAEYVKKGHQLAVSGSIQTGSYENKEGQRVFTTDVIVNDFTFAESRNTQNNQSQPQQPQQNQQANSFGGDAINITDDDLPF